MRSLFGPLTAPPGTYAAYAVFAARDEAKIGILSKVWLPLLGKKTSAVKDPTTIQQLSKLNPLNLNFKAAILDSRRIFLGN